MSRRFFALVTCGLGLAVPAMADVNIEPLKGEQFRVLWNGREVVRPSRPALARFGGGVREVYDPTTRQLVKVDLRQTEALTLLNRKQQRVLLEPGKLTVKKDAESLIYREEFPKTKTWWQVTLSPVQDNGLDVFLEIETSPAYWLSKFRVGLFDLNMTKAVGDNANLRRPKKKGGWPVPVSGNMRVHYPSGPASFVPAIVMQDQQLAMGVCLLGAHTAFRPHYNELNLRQGEQAYSVDIDSGWADLSTFGNLYRHEFRTHYRFRFAAPKPVGKAGYLRLVDAKELWQDYLDELDREVPKAPAPALDRSKNNIIVTNYFMAEEIYATPRNPNGWLMNHPGWKDDPWEWQEKISSKMDEAEIKRRTGFSSENFGPPVKWIKPFAERSVREMKETNSQALVVWRSTISFSGKGDTNYIPETHCFHPELEEFMPVEGSVRNWDWAQANITVRTAAGDLVAVKKDVLLHAADTERLIQNNRSMNYIGTRQILSFVKEDLRDGAEPFLAKARVGGPRERLMLKYVLRLDLVLPREPLLGKKPGDTAKLEVRVRSHDRQVTQERLVLEAQITGVRRAAIDVWAKTLTDAGVEIGFLIREDLTVGPPWEQWTRGLDYAGQWQYMMIKQRLQWHRERFGDRCRWFYLDVFGDFTPLFVYDMLRSDFPGCFFLVEHPNDMAYRVVQGWKWSGFMTDLEKYVCPDALLTVLPSRMLTGNEQKDNDTLKRLWRNPNYLMITHRGARNLVKRCQQAIGTAGK